MSCSRKLSKTLSRFCSENYSQLTDIGYKRALKERNLWNTLQNPKKLYSYLDSYCMHKFKTASANVVSFEDIAKLCQFTSNSFGFALNIFGGRYNTDNCQFKPHSFPTTSRILQIDVDLRTFLQNRIESTREPPNLDMPSEQAFYGESDKSQSHKETSKVKEVYNTSTENEQKVHKTFGEIVSSDSSTSSDEMSDSDHQHDENNREIAVEIHDDALVEQVDEFQELRNLVKEVKQFTTQIVDRWMATLDAVTEKSFYKSSCTHVCSEHLKFRKPRGRPVKRLTKLSKSFIKT